MSVLKIKDSAGKFISVPALKGDRGLKGDKGATGAKGDKGDTGNSGVYMGTTAPTDSEVRVWIDTSQPDDFASIVQAVYDMLPVAEEVEF